MDDPKPKSAARSSLSEVRAQDERDGIIVPPSRKKRSKVKPTAQGLVSDDEALTRFAVVYGSDVIWDTSMMIPMKPVALRLAIGNDVFKTWCSNPLKRVVHPNQIVFDPTGTCGLECVNLFKGLPSTPVKGDCSDMVSLLMHLVSESADSDDGIAATLNFVLDWLAYPLQHPGAKMATALVFHGPQGTGKNLFFEAYAQIFGEYGAVIGQAQLESRYNDWASRKLFLIGDEIVASNELTHHKNALKSYVTSDTVQVETKFQPVRTEKNHANFVFLSNDNRPLALERDDRRHLVVYCPPKNQDGLYERVRSSLERGAVDALYDFLMTRNLADFHPHTLPPMTRAKSDLIELGLRPAERFAKQWLSKDLDLPLRACSTGQLYKAFMRWCRTEGERLPPNQANFSAAVTRYAHNRLTRKTASPSPSEHGSPIVLWLPTGTGPMDGVRWYDFAKDAVDQFDVPLSRFGSQSTEGHQ